MSNVSAASVISHFYRHQFYSSTPPLEALGFAGGFSGARFWRVGADPDRFCLRRWPKPVNGDASRIGWIHKQLATVFQKGCSFVPVPLPADSGRTLVRHDGYLWQLEPWMPGEAIYWKDPTPLKLQNAMQSIAQFHQSLRPVSVSTRPAPGILMRIKRMDELFCGSGPTDLFRRIESSCQVNSPDDLFRGLGLGFCSQFRNTASPVLQSLNHVANTAVETQTVMGDVWHDHVLFTGELVTGIVDFGAMRQDSRSADIARLLGSLVGDDADLRKCGLEIYRKSSALSDTESRLVEVFDASTTLISGMNWLQWICVEGRHFEDYRSITRRLDKLSRRMDFLADSL